MQLEGEESQHRTKKSLKPLRGRKEVIAEMSEDLSEGEKGDTLSDISTPGGSRRGKMTRISSVNMLENLAKQQKEKKLYLVLIRHEFYSFNKTDKQIPL